MSDSNRLDEALHRFAAEGKKGFLPYMTAGLPTLEATPAILDALAAAGVTAVEIGFPYSDPIADGPTIQASYTRALERGVRVREIFAAIAAFRQRSQLPLLAMLSYSIVYRVGLDAFLRQAKEAGIDGLILPDLSLEEAPEVARAVRGAGLRMPMLVSPVTSAERRRRIAELSSGFVYYMSVTGITGERRELPPELVRNVRELREAAGLPVIVGFGISTAEQVRLVCSEADGVIIGSALVRRIMEADDAGKNTDSILDVVRSAVTDWMSGLPA